MAAQGQDPFGGVVRALVGRDAELSDLAAGIAAEGSPRAIVLTGPPGIGKTSLHENAIRSARERGHRVMSARATNAGTSAPFGALIDLCDGIDDDDLAGLPEPQRTALEVALIRATPGESPPNPRAIALGFRAVVKNICERGPTVLAIDDAQWLDRSSLEVLTFFAHRLGDEDICLLMTRSSRTPTEVETAVEHVRLNTIEVGPLSLGAVRRILIERLGLSLSRALLRRVADAAEGNPLFVLELGRELEARGLPATAADLPIPAHIEDLLSVRIGALAEQPRRALMALALCPTAGIDELISVAGQRAVDEAIDGGLLQIDGHRIRASHPLLGAAALRTLSQRDRRALHHNLAHAISNPEQRAMHLALATPGTDETLASTVARAAAAASARGSRQQAVELAEHAWRITPTESPEYADRVLALAECLEAAGEKQRLSDLLTAQFDAIPSGPQRARAFFLLAEGARFVTMEEMEDLWRRALAEDPGGAALTAKVLAKRACYAAAGTIMNIPQASAWAIEASRLTRHAGPGLRRGSLYALAWARVMVGESVEDLCRASAALADPDSCLAPSPERVAAQRLVWRGEIPAARKTLKQLQLLADERGEIESYALMRLHTCELHLRVGEWDAAERLLDEWAESSDRQLMFPPMYERCRALLAAGRGDVDGTQQSAALAIILARESGCRWDEFESLRAAAMGSLVAHEPTAAVAVLLPVWRSLQDEGVEEPGVFPVAPELVQALVECDDLPQAQAVTDWLALLAARGEHPWAAVTLRRCRALVALAGSDGDDAALELVAASAQYDELGLVFDSGRCLLSLGRAQRRRRQWGSARGVTKRAIAIFDAIGSTGWAARARDDLERMGVRRTGPDGGLTPSEQRAADLAAVGRSNKEIARQLGVGVHTVEVHLSRAYAKLGVRSRGQLAAQLSSDNRLTSNDLRTIEVCRY